MKEEIYEGGFGVEKRQATKLRNDKVKVKPDMTFGSATEAFNKSHKCGTKED